MLFRLFGLSLCRMHGSVAVLRRGIESIESQWLAACVDDVVASARGHKDSIAILDFRRLAIDPNFAVSLFQAEELIAVGVHFLADLLTGLQGHEHKLKVLAGVQNAPEIRIGICQVFDIGNEAPRRGASFSLHLHLMSGLAALLHALGWAARSALLGNGRGAQNRRGRSCEDCSLHCLLPVCRTIFKRPGAAMVPQKGAQERNLQTLTSNNRHTVPVQNAEIAAMLPLDNSGYHFHIR
jgi:hypothetical protein